MKEQCHFDYLAKHNLAIMLHGLDLTERDRQATTDEGTTTILWLEISKMCSALSTLILAFCSTR